MSVELSVYPLGPLQVNTCLLRDGAACAIVDPTVGVAPLVRQVLQDGAQLQCLLLTHGHGDHIAGIEEVRALVPEVPVFCPAADAHMLSDPQANLSVLVGILTQPGEPDRLLNPGDTVSVGQSLWQVLDTSGHTAGGVSYYCAQAEVAIVGDSLFAGGIGRYDLPGGSFRRLRDNVRAHLFTLPGPTRVIPGHGPETTIQVERTTNQFFLLS
ncbi:MAG: MBL fold metallo-hydrolase [Planctomycetota bacterium]|nr:MBL fold metallo-hydrolase [Planctomycetota bacterium]